MKLNLTKSQIRKLEADAKAAVPERQWICDKCDQLRSNKKTHIHGVSILPKYF